MEGSGGGGGKGGGGQQRVPVEAADSFRSNAVARAILAYSVGETQGLVNGAKSIYFDGTPLQNSDNTFNFSGVTWEERFGLPTQERVRGFEQTTIVKSIGANLTIAEGPVIRTVDSASVDSVRIILTFPVLQLVDQSTGDINANTVVVNFAVRNPATGTWIDRGNQTITGKSSGPFQLQYRIDGPPNPTVAWEWRVTRITADSTTTTNQNSTQVDTVVEVRESVQTYPGVAYVAVQVDTSLFGNKIPNVSLRVSGVKVKVPVNYTETGGVPAYSGTWNGTFKFASTSNPVWHIYNMIINNKYGLEIPEDFLDKYAFYTIAQYCDAVNPTTGAFVGISDGNGGFRRRFTFNTQINQDDDALTMLQNMASSFRGLLYYGAGAIVPSQDRPKSVSAIITNENVLDGKIVYSSTEAKDRITVANIAYNDKDNFYAPSFATYPPVEDWDTDPNIARYGRNIYDGAKFGCNNEAEAFTFAKWIVYSSVNETETAQFTVGPEHATLRPGDVVEIYDRRFVKERFGGRILGADINTITLDAPVTLNAGQTYTLTIVGNDGKTLVTRNIETPAGTYQNIDVAPNFPAIPTLGYTWAIKGTDIQPRTFRIINIEKKSLLEYEVFAMFHDLNKYIEVENDVTLIEQPFRRLEFNQLNPVSNINFEVNARNDPARGTINSLRVRWTRSTSELATRYRVRYSRNGAQYIEWGITAFTEVEIDNVTDGTYSVLIYAQNAAGKESIPATADFTIAYGGTDVVFGGSTLTIQPPIINNVS
jgi:predicted phage tail protein